MPTSNRSDFRHWSRRVSATNRIAVYGPVCTVVWQGSVGDCCPYADQAHLCGIDTYVALELRAAQVCDELVLITT
jgi:hypothetical protein